MGFKAKKPGQGQASLPTKSVTQVSAPAVVANPQPVAAPEAAAPKTPSKPKPVKVKTVKKQASTEGADVQINVYLTKSEVAALDYLLDGRPRSGFLRKQIQKLIGGDHV